MAGLDNTVSSRMNFSAVRDHGGGKEMGATIDRLKHWDKRTAYTGEDTCAQALAF